MDGLVQRGVSAGLGFVLAAITSPEDVGSYSSVAIVLGLYQLAFDIPMRQVAIRVSGNQPEMQKLTRALWIGSSAGAAMIIAALGLLVAFGRIDLFSGLMLLPIALTPLASGANVNGLAALQCCGEWRRIAALRLIGFAFASAATLPLLIGTRVIVFAACQIALSEVVVSILVLLMRRNSIDTTAGIGEDVHSRSLLGHAVAYQALGYFRVQADRFTLIACGTTSAVGSYSVTFSLGRAFLEAPLGSLINVVRAKLARFSAHDVDSVREVLGQYSARFQFYGLAGWVGTSLLAVPVAGLLLNSSWNDAMAASSILACALPSTIQVWVLSAGAMHCGIASRGYAVQIAGVVLGVGVGICLAIDLVFGSWMFLVRETLLAALSIGIYRELATKRSVVIWILMVTAGIVCAEVAAIEMHWLAAP